MPNDDNTKRGATFTTTNSFSFLATQIVCANRSKAIPSLSPAGIFSEQKRLPEERRSSNRFQSLTQKVTQWREIFTLLSDRVHLSHQSPRIMSANGRRDAFSPSCTVLC